MIESRDCILLTQIACEHCLFDVYMPRFSFSRPVLCPRCWRPLPGVDRHDEVKLTSVEFSSFTETSSRQATESKSSPVTTPTATPEASKLENRFDSGRISRLEYSPGFDAESDIEQFNGGVECCSAGDCLQYSFTEEADDPQEPICLQTEQPEDNLSYRERIRRWFASCAGTARSARRCR